MTTPCTICGHYNRSTAKFCGKCGATIVAYTPPATTSPPGTGPGVGDKAKDVANRVGAVAGPAMVKAGAAVAPVARGVAEKGWQGSKKGMGVAARIVTGGGRAAYSEAFNPHPYVTGRVSTVTPTTLIPFPLEWAFILFVLSLGAIWFLFALSDVATGVTMGAIFLLLLLLSWFGIRRPFFTRLTFDGLLARIRPKRPQQVPQHRFQIIDDSTHQPLEVVMVGHHQGTLVSPGDSVALWGIRDASRNELRAWKVQSTHPTGQQAHAIVVPRLFPLTVALFLPIGVSLLVWLLSLLLR